MGTLTAGAITLALAINMTGTSSTMMAGNLSMEVGKTPEIAGKSADVTLD
jgi:hypothetical protein